ncbi:hypothetical protein MUO71_06420 [Candidatus Bathyarchaeota archaeon]|nr:hypothetical protein [Candidatus Bathyarchaeota archaeon]
MLKQSKIAILMIMLTVAVLVVPASAYFSSQNVETKAERMVEIADAALEKVMALVDIVESNDTIWVLITDAELDGDFYGNVSLVLEEGTPLGSGTADVSGEGWVYLNASKEALLVAEEAEDFQVVIDNAREALTIFRDVYRAINVILVDVGVEIEQPLQAEVIQEAIDRSQTRVDELKALISSEAPIYQKLIDAEGNLTKAIGFLPDNVEDAKSSLREANVLISEVCQYLKEVAQELNPQRIRDYCENAYRHRERFRGGFEQAETEGFDVNGFLQGFGYQNEDDFMTRFQEMIQNAEGTEDLEDVLEDLNEIGRTIREMDQGFTTEMGHYRAQHGHAESGSGFGQNMGEYGGSGGSGQMGFGGGQ